MKSNKQNTIHSFTELEVDDIFKNTKLREVTVDLFL